MTYTNVCPKCGNTEVCKHIIKKGFLAGLNRFILIVLTLGYYKQFDHIFTEYECKECGLKWTI